MTRRTTHDLIKEIHEVVVQQRPAPKELVEAANNVLDARYNPDNTFHDLIDAITRLAKVLGREKEVF